MVIPPRNVAWTLHPDRALPAEPEVRRSARAILDATETLPIVSMHGHVEASLLADDEAFSDPSSLLVTPDHYLVRLLVSQASSEGAVRAAGVRTVADLGVGGPDSGAERDPRVIWRRFCAGWAALRGTPTRYWMEHVLATVFEAPAPPSPGTADELYTHIGDRLSQPEYRPRALFERFGIEILATTDSATADLSPHRRLAAQGWGERIIPTFRPDTLLEAARPGWKADLHSLAETSGVQIRTYDDYISALEDRRRFFIEHGARASDHGHFLADTTPLPLDEARGLFDRARAGSLTPDESARFTAHMLFEMARMSSRDGLVMQLHTGVQRDHDRAASRAFGHDIGYDIPVRAEFTRALRPVLEEFGHSPQFRMIAFTVDETVYSRELAPLAGVYPALRLGAPWWFLDAPDAIQRFRAATTETAGLYNTSGFVDDTRAFCSIPARHDLARRADAAFLARLVSEHRLSLYDAMETAADLAYHLPKASYPRPPRLAVSHIAEGES